MLDLSSSVQLNNGKGYEKVGSRLYLALNDLRNSNQHEFKHL